MSDNSRKNWIGLSISMHNEVQEATRAVKSFHKFHPNSEIKLWGNKEAELKEVGTILGIQVLDSPQYVDQLMNLLHSDGEKNYEAAAQILREFLICALGIYSQMNCKYVVYMHPDHLVVRRFKESRLICDLEIHKVNRYSEKQRKAWFEATGKELGLESYGLAGYFRRESLIAALKFLLDSEKINLELLMSRDLDFIYEDLIIPCAFDYLGFEIRDQNITREMRRRRRLRSFFFRPLLLHQVPKII